MTHLDTGPEAWAAEERFRTAPSQAVMVLTGQAPD